MISSRQESRPPLLSIDLIYYSSVNVCMYFHSKVSRASASQRLQKHRCRLQTRGGLRGRRLHCITGRDSRRPEHSIPGNHQLSRRATRLDVHPFQFHLRRWQRFVSPYFFSFLFFSKRWKMYAWKRSFDVEICECWLISSNDSNFICSCLTDCAEKLKDSLFMVGEIGGNDYNYALFQGKSIEEVKSLVPSVVQAIANAVRVSSHWSIELCFRYFLLSRSK